MHTDSVAFPLSFQPILARLEQLQKQDKLDATYLFIGNKGIGKVNLVRYWLSTFYCVTHNSCGHCSHCVLLAKEEHPNFTIIKPATKQLLLSQIKEVIALTNIKALLPVKRVILIQEAHKMNIEATNSFLKLLEEPPKNTLFILLVPQEGLLLETIESRCQKFIFPPLSKEDINLLLKQSYTLSEEQKQFILAYAQGRLQTEWIDNIETLLTMRMDIYTMLIQISNKETKSHSLQSYFLAIENIIKKDLLSFYLTFLASWLSDFAKYKQGLNSFLYNQDLDPSLLQSWQANIKQTQEAFQLVITTEKNINKQATKQLALESLLLNLFFTFH